MYTKLRLLFLLLTTLVTGAVYAQQTDPNLGIIPAPVSLTKTTGIFTLSQLTTILADSTNNKAVQFLASYLQNKQVLRNQVKKYTGGTATNAIVLTSRGAESLAPEGYRLTITPHQVTIIGKGAGLFYGIQSLLQLFPVERKATVQLPCLQAEDYPRFKYRGIMLDVSRHFYSVEYVKKIIDLMAAYKLNNFHWHLTDDQGWRIEIKKYPKLTQIGSKRAQSLIGNYHDRMPQQFDNTPHGGYYTQEQIRDVVRYAATRFINVVPEIEMPGHSVAAITAYPELGCDTKTPAQVRETWAISDNVFCPSEYTFNFLQDVLTEVISLFPSKYIHIGGDEVPKTAWKASPLAQELIKKNKLKDEHGLQSYFVQRIEKFVNSKGRSIIGWDEILEGGLAPNATVMSWRGEAGGIAAAQQKHNVIMTPGSGGLYLDHSQGRSNLEPLSIGNYAPLSKTYSYNPQPAALTPEQQQYILGVQANLWSEYIATEAKSEYMLLPRMLAVAEVGWSPLAKKNFTDFNETRLPGHLAWLDANRYNYRVPTAIGAKDTSYTGSQLTVDLKAPVEGAKIYYTIDGYTPNETDLEYAMPFTLNVPADQYREVKTIVITPTGKRSVVTTTRVNNKAALPAINTTAKAPGAKYQLFTGDFKSADQLVSGREADTGVVKTFNTTAFKKANRTFGISYTGYFMADADAKYIFSTLSDDGSVIYIDDQLVVDNDGKHSTLEQSGEVLLKRGMHKFTLRYFDAGGNSKLQVFLTVPGKPKGEFSAETLVN